MRPVCSLTVPCLAAMFALVGPCPTGQAQVTGQKFALLIGVNTYRSEQIKDLTFADADAEELGNLLKDQGFKVLVLPSRRAVRDEIVAELYDASRRLKPEDIFLLYFAGHGLKNSVNQHTYWLAHDASIDSPDIGGIRLEHLLDYVRDIKAGRKLILLDHCLSANFSGAFTPTPTPAPVPTPVPAPLVLPGGPAAAAPPTTPAATSRASGGAVRLSRAALAVPDFIETMASRAKGTAYFAASRGDAFELESLGHGVFTQAFLQACRTREADIIVRDARLSLAELGAYMRPEVSRLLAKARVPNQEVVFEVQGSQEWDVCTLPVGEPEAAASAQRWKTTLLEWSNKGWISTDNRLRCHDVLVKWTDNGGNESRLSEADQLALRQIRSVIDGSRPAQARADALKVFLDGETPPR